jgi:predicted nuclease of predicted toxin-antitoxin system
MRLLLDENLPKRLKLDFPEHEIYTVRDMQCNGIKNGDLLNLLLNNNFDALLTFDKNFQHQQSFSNYSISVFVLIATINQYKELTKLTPKIKFHLNSGQLPGGPIIIFTNS